MALKLTSYEAALDYLYSFHRPMLPPDPRGPIVQALLKRLGVHQTQKSPRIAHITGTNGKGSVCAYLELFLRCADHQTVVLTSPHINSVRERIRFNGTPLSKQVFIELLEQAAPALEFGRGTDLHPAPTTIITILALILQERLDRKCFGIYEVGSGGEHDSTNVFDRALVGLTKVGDDHVEQFGGSLITLLVEKLGLCRPGGLLVHQEQDESLQPILERYCHESRVTVDKANACRVGIALSGALLPGAWQLENASLAYEMFRRMEPTSPSLETLNQFIGHQRAIHPGRLESRIVQARNVTLDGAHNLPAMRCVLHHFRNEQRGENDCTAILGFSTEKRWRDMVEQIVKSGVFSTLVLTRSTRPRGVEPQALAEYASALTKVPVLAMPSLRAALEWTLASTCGQIVLSGSLLLVGDFDKALHALGLHKWAVPFEHIDPPQPWMHAL